jgi:TRAP-type C4-dicarboxylate transport system substrate-binding protein
MKPFLTIWLDLSTCRETRMVSVGGKEPDMMRIGGYQGDSSVLTRGMRRFIAELGDGPLANSIAFTPDVTVAGDSARGLFDGVEAGRWQIAYIASGYLSARVPGLSFLDLPMLVSDRAAALAALDGSAGGYLVEDIQTATGLKVLGFWDNGFRHITNGTRPIRSPRDCAGLTIRTLDSPIYRATLAAFGFTPMFADVRDFAAKIAAGEIDAQENPLTNVVQFGIHRYHAHVSLTGHVFGVALMVANGAWFDSLDTVTRHAIGAAAREATLFQRQLAADEDSVALKTLNSFGSLVIRPDGLDLEAFQAAARPIHDQVLRSVPRRMIEAWLG